MPCAVPLGWRIEALDPRFGVDLDEARQAVGAAAELWGRAVGRQLFVRDPVEGMPIRFVYDARQDRTRQLATLEERLSDADAGLEEGRSELEEMEVGYGSAHARYEEDVRALQGHLAAHNDSVRLWNERGGAPARVHARLEAAGGALEAEAERLKTRENEL
ncbi:MAG TPA: hypothetical protein VE173_04525, partial [Longimicrobiales bacterium]|nr:hypothetical protein [Longimicrobiales bacterium]